MRRETSLTALKSPKLLQRPSVTRMSSTLIPASRPSACASPADVTVDQPATMLSPNGEGTQCGKAKKPTAAPSRLGVKPAVVEPPFPVERLTDDLVEIIAR